MKLPKTTHAKPAPKQGVYHQRWLAECADHDRTRAALLVYLVGQERGLEALRRELRVPGAGADGRI